MSLAPKDAGIQALLAALLTKMNRPEEASAARQRALTLAHNIYPEFQDQLISDLEKPGP